MLILASRSPRRREILASAGIPHLVRPAEVDESIRDGEAAEPYVKRVARAKAEAVEAGTGDVVLGTRVRFQQLSEQEIDAYVASGEPLDKAGAYAIQGLASKFIDRVEGCYFNVVGLPVANVYALLRSFSH